MKRRNRAHLYLLGLFAASLQLVGCGAKDLNDLNTYSAEVLARKGGAVPPLPEVKPYERYLYQSADAGARDPFEPLFNGPRNGAPEARPRDAENRYVQEIQSHHPEELEGFELDSLRMVGTLANDQDIWGIVVDHEGTVHRVRVGNYMGRNYGKIMTIGADRIDLREIISDGQGGWEERRASLALNEQ